MNFDLGTGSTILDVIVVILSVVVLIVITLLVAWLGCEIGSFVYDAFGTGGLAGFCTFLLCGAIASSGR